MSSRKLTIKQGPPVANGHVGQAEKAQTEKWLKILQKNGLLNDWESNFILDVSNMLKKHSFLSLRQYDVIKEMVLERLDLSQKARMKIGKLGKRRLFVYLCRFGSEPAYVGHTHDVEKRIRGHIENSQRLFPIALRENARNYSFEIVGEVLDIPSGPKVISLENRMMKLHGTHRPTTGKGWNFLLAHQHEGDYRTTEEVLALRRSQWDALSSLKGKEGRKVAALYREEVLKLSARKQGVA